MQIGNLLDSTIREEYPYGIAITRSIFLSPTVSDTVQTLRYIATSRRHIPALGRTILSTEDFPIAGDQRVSHTRLVRRKDSLDKSRMSEL